MFAVFVLPALFTMAPVPQDANKKTIAALQGKWVVVKAETNGEKLELPKELSLTFDGDTVTSSGMQDKKSKFRIDASKTPMELDMFDGKETEALGVFELDGDTLKLCLGSKRIEQSFQVENGKLSPPVVKLDPRPAKLDSKLGLLTELRREKK